MHIRHAAAAIAMLAATPCLAAVRWAGDFESGNLNQWTKRQEVSADRLAIVSDPVHQGRYALRVTVKQGDDPINASGNRNELVQLDDTREGTEAYYRWHTMFAPDFPSAEAWQLFAQWHQPEDCCGSPPIQFYVYGEELRFTVSEQQKQVWRAPLERGVWQDFILHVRFSDDPRVGFVELWHNGELVVPKTYAATRADSYLKLGLYRAESIRPTGVLYQDGMVRGETLEDVMPAASPPPSPTPPADPGPPNTPQPPTPTPPTPGGGSSGTTIASSGSSGGPSTGGCSAAASAPALAAVGLLATLVQLRDRRRRHLVR